MRWICRNTGGPPNKIMRLASLVSRPPSSVVAGGCLKYGRVWSPSYEIILRSEMRKITFITLKCEDKWEAEPENKSKKHFPHNGWHSLANSAMQWRDELLLWCCAVAAAALFHTDFLRASMMIKWVRWGSLQIENRAFTENCEMPIIFSFGDCKRIAKRLNCKK